MKFTQVYHNLYQAVTRLYASEGAIGFYRGVSAALAQTVPQGALQFGCYKFYKELLEPTLGTHGNDITANYH